MLQVEIQPTKCATPPRRLGFKHVFHAIIIGSRALTDEIVTRFFKIEQILNARPLVPANADPVDLHVLTPNHFLLGTAGSSLQSTLSKEFDHRKLYARTHAYSDAIWIRWLREYVPTLNRRTKWSSSANRDLKTGIVVWIDETTNPRAYYLLARVVNLNCGRDAIARSAEVKTTTGNMIRPTVKLAPVLLPPDPS